VKHTGEGNRTFPQLERLVSVYYNILMNLQVTNIQVALFSPGIDLSDKLALAQKVKQGTGTLFDGESIVLPIPNDAPAEIPRIVLRNKNNQISLNLSLNKIDFFIKPKSNNSLTNSSDEANKIYKSFLETLYKDSSLVIHRVGHVFNLQAPVDNSVDFISMHYFGDFKNGESWQDINFGLLKRDVIDEKLSNIWFRINPGKKQDGDLDMKKIAIMFDINTLPKEIHKYDAGSILKYLEESTKYSEIYSKKLLK